MNKYEYEGDDLTAQQRRWINQEKFGTVQDERVILVQATSAGYKSGNFAKITINEQAIMVENNIHNHDRGLHIVLIHPYTGGVSLAQVFDTYKSSETFDRFIKEFIPVGFIVVAACKDECVTNLSYEARKWFADMGSDDIWHISYR